MKSFVSNVSILGEGAIFKCCERSGKERTWLSGVYDLCAEERCGPKRHYSREVRKLILASVAGTYLMLLHRYADQKALDYHLRSEYLVEAAGILDAEDLLTEPLQLADVFVERVAELNRERGWKGPDQVGQ